MTRGWLCWLTHILENMVSVNCPPHVPQSDILIEWESIRKRSPDALAIRDCDGSLTYEMLAHDSDSWARCLISGVNEGPVVVHAPNGTCLASAILGVLKAGRVCVPVAENTPSERVRQLVELSNAGTLISSESILLEEARQWGDTINLIGNYADRLTGVLHGNERELPLPTCSPQTAAFLMFTSGTEGRPKPVILRHGNIVRECHYFRRLLALSADDRASWFYATSALAGLRELMMSLLTGSSLSAFSYAELGAEKMANWLREERITVCRFVPTMFRQFCSMLDFSETFPSVRVFYIGGEGVLPSDFELFRRHFPNAGEFSIVYGSTETGLCFENSIPAGQSPTARGGLPLGRPVPGYNLRIANPEEDHSGELVVSGACLNQSVADGEPLDFYLKSQPAGISEHLSGDQVRVDEDGCWHFVSRIRDFVKISGNRVGLDEVKSAVLQLDSVEDCRIEASQGSLTALVKFANGDSVLTTDEIRAALLAILPPYMVPADIRLLAQMPLTPGGKADITTPLAPKSKMADHQKGKGGRWSPTERMVGDVWAVTLHRESIGIDESFFALGGSSLLAVVAAARLSESLGRSVPPALFASCPNVRAMAAALEKLAPDEKWSVVVPLRSKGTKLPLFLFQPVGGGVMNYLPLVEKLDPGRPIIGLQAHGLDGVSTPSASIPEAASRFLQEILRVNPEGPFLLAGHSFGGRLAFEAASQLHEMGHPVSFVGLFDSHPNMSTRYLPTAEALRFMGTRVRFHLARLALMDTSQRMAWFRRLGRKVARESRASGNVISRPPSELASLSRSIAMVRKCCLKASAEYVPGSYPGRVILFKAQRQSLELRPDRDYGWSKFAHGGVRVIEVPGSHASILSPPHVDYLVRKLNGELQTEDLQLTFS